MPSFFEDLASASIRGEPCALALLSHTKGSSPLKTGAKALFYPDGRICGTLGGGCLEAEVQDRARRAIQTGEASTFELVLDHDFGWDDGLICGGKVCGIILPHAREAAEIWRTLSQEILQPMHWGVRNNFKIEWLDAVSMEGWLYKETAIPRTHLWIAGSGHLAQAVVPLGLQLDFDVTVFDDRPALANHRNFPAATHFEVDAWETLARKSIPTSPTFGLIVTRGHQHDALVLRDWIKRPFLFLAMIGSRRKARIIFEQFLEEKIATPEQLNQVACPAGLDIQAGCASEIAVSIIAQLIQKRAAWRTDPNSAKLTSVG